MRKNNWLTYAVATLMLWGLWAFLSKINANLNGAVNGLMYEIIGSVIIGILTLFFLKFKIAYNQKGSLFSALSGLFAMGGMLTFLYSLKLGNSVVVIPMTALYPGITVILCRIFLKEKISMKQFIGVLFALIASFLLGW